MAKRRKNVVKVNTGSNVFVATLDEVDATAMLDCIVKLRDKSNAHLKRRTWEDFTNVTEETARLSEVAHGLVPQPMRDCRTVRTRYVVRHTR